MHNDDNDDDAGSIPYGAIAGGVSGAVGVLIPLVICIVIVCITYYKRKEHQVDNQGTCSTANTQVQQTVQPYPVQNVSNFMESGNTPSINNSDHCHQYDDAGACNTAHLPQYDVYVPADYEIAKLAEQVEMDEYYLDMNPVKEHTDEQPPEYETIQDEKPAYQNWKPASSGASNPRFYTMDDSVTKL